MISLREHRLLNVRKDTLKTDTTTQYNARTAQANADQQAAQYRAQLAANQAQTVGLNANGQGTVAAPVAPVALNPALANAQNTYANQAAGLQSQITQQNQNGMVAQSGVMAAGDGTLQQSAIDRLRASGMSEDQIRSEMQAYPQNVQGAMEQVGQAAQQQDSAFGGQSSLNPAQAAEKAAQDAKAQYEQLGIGDPAVIAQAMSQARQNVLNEQAAQANLQTAQGQQQQGNLASDAAANAAGSKQADQAPQMTPQQQATTAAASMLLAGLPPEQQSILAPAVNALMSAYQTGEANNAQAYEGAVGSAQDTFKQEQTVLGLLGKSYQELKGQTQDVLDTVKDDQLKNLAEQQKVVQDRLAWEQVKAERELKRQETKVHDQMIARLALSGGFGSDGGLNEINSATVDFESAIADLGVEYSLQQSEVAVKFSTLYNNTLDTYKVDSLNNLKEYQSNLERLSQQSLSSTRALNDASQKALEGYLGNQTALRLDSAKAVQGITKDVQAQITQNQNVQFQKEQYGMQQLKWIADTYGSYAPATLVESVAKNLPGVDVQNILNTMTLEQRKKASGSGGLSGFSSYLMKSGGQPPSFDDFINAKEAELGMSLDATERARYKAEYDAKLSVTNQLSPAEIVNRFKMKATTLTGPTRKYAESTLKEYLDAGQYQLASDFVDNTGDDIPSTQANDFTQALNSRYNVQKMSQLFDDIGMTFPGVGLVRELNPLDDRVVRYKQNLTQTIPGLARGIFKEVGVLTDSDIERYTSTMANPNLTTAQARAAFDDLKERIEVSMQNQINVWDAGGKRVKGMRDLYNAAPLNASSGDPTSQADEDFARSILSGL